MSGALPVFDAVVAELRHDGNTGHVESLLDARAAVAELVEATDAEYAALVAHLAKVSTETREAYFIAMQRRRAAHAWVKGESA